MVQVSTLFLASLVAVASARPTKRAAFTLRKYITIQCPDDVSHLLTNMSSENGKDAQALNTKFASLTADSACTDGDQACVDNGFAQCVGGKFSSTPCAGGTKCVALPLVNKAGTVSSRLSSAQIKYS